ncbi:hypothetical protein [Lachnobacterium bovis]|uniref:hypothetical protein n=1 Tax=Lachnobacterium bovis TaxID=140626 RepID=UPI00048F1CE6|nr:hypothetical protein [Lachnobacterium bovis]
MIYDHEHSLEYAPEAWKKFVKQGRNGIIPLAAPRMHKIPTRFEQLRLEVIQKVFVLDASKSYKTLIKIEQIKK